MSFFLAQMSEAGSPGPAHLNEPALLFTLIFCFIVFLIFMVMFSDRLFIETSPRFPLEVAEQSMVLAKLPFQVEFIELDKANLSDGVSMKVNTEESIEILSFWGPSCALVIHALNNESLSLLTEDLELEHLYTERNHLHPGQEQLVHLAPQSSADDLNLGPPPRLKYPLVLIFRCQDLGDTSQENHIVAGVWVIHVPDSVFKQSGHIISHIVITNHGMVHTLQKMFMAADHSSDNPPESSLPLPDVSLRPTHDREELIVNPCLDGEESDVSQEPSPEGKKPNVNPEPSLGVESSSVKYSYEGGEGFNSLEDGEHDCTVCQSNPITRVILPCRHACICEECFKLVNKCPMCRGPIVSHFSLYPAEIRSEHYYHDMVT